MTGGQSSPLTCVDTIAPTTPYGNIEAPFDICSLAIAAGATYVARSTTYHALQLPELIASGIRHHGFSVIEVFTGCPTYFGKFNNQRSAAKMLEWQRDHSVNLKQYQLLSEEAKAGKFAIGMIHSVERAEYTDEYSKIIQRVRNNSPKDAS